MTAADSSWRLEVDRSEFRSARLIDEEPKALSEGEVRLAIERLALTANNMTYALLGEALGYWDLFPASPGWGRIPAWGEGVVIASKQMEIAVGGRFFGLFPMSSHLFVQARKTGRGFAGQPSNRVSLNPVYNQYFDVSGLTVAESEDNSLFRPLVVASFTLNEHLREQSFFGADAVMVTSSSSKTALALAMLLADAIPVFGATSPQNIGFVEASGSFLGAFAYSDVGRAEFRGRCLIVDFSGDARTLDRMASDLGDRVVGVCRVGKKHWETAGRDPIQSSFSQIPDFFAPTQIQRLIAAWGPARFEQRLSEAIQRFAGRSRDWFTKSRVDGRPGLARAYDDLAAGRFDPARLVIARPNR